MTYDRTTINAAAAILFYVFMQSVVVRSECDSIIVKRFPGYHVISPVLRTVTCPGDACSLPLCAVSCEDNSCVAVSFNVVDKICHQHDKPIYSPEVRFEESPDWEYLQLISGNTNTVKRNTIFSRKIKMRFFYVEQLSKNNLKMK